MFAHHGRHWLAGVFLATVSGSLGAETPTRPPGSTSPASVGTAATSATSKSDPRIQALTSWIDGAFMYGAGEVQVENLSQQLRPLPGYQIYRAVKKYVAENGPNDQCFALVEDTGSTIVVGELFPDEARMKAPAPVRTDADLEGFRNALKRYLQGKFRVSLDPSADRLSLKGVRVTVDTGYGSFDMTGFVSADGSLCVLGRPWDRRRSLVEQRREAIKLTETPFQGPSDAAVTIVEYSDMQCGYCRKRTADWEPLLQKMAPLLKMKRYVKSFPLFNNHPWAFRASSAARCFFEKDPALFFRWKANVYARQELMTVSDIDNFALDFAAANDVADDAIKGCYLQPKSTARVLADLAEGYTIRVRSTPTYVIDGVLVSWYLDDLMEEYLRKTYLKGAGLPLPTKVPTGTKK